MLSLYVPGQHVVKLTLPDGRTILIRRHQGDHLGIEAPLDIRIERLGYIDIKTMREMCGKVHEDVTDGDGVKEDADHV